MVFNLCESLRSDNRFEALLPMLLEYEGLVYTGSPPQTLLQALHKDKAKRLLSLGGVPTPPAVVLDTPDTRPVDLVIPPHRQAHPRGCFGGDRQLLGRVHTRATR